MQTRTIPASELKAGDVLVENYQRWRVDIVATNPRRVARTRTRAHVGPRGRLPYPGVRSLVSSGVVAGSRLARGAQRRSTGPCG